MLIDSSTLYEQRLLVFLETEPQSNKYNQVLFTPSHFKKVSLVIQDGFPKEKCDNCDEYHPVLRLGDEDYTLADLRSYED